MKRMNKYTLTNTHTMHTAQCTTHQANGEYVGVGLPNYTAITELHLKLFDNACRLLYYYIYGELA